MHKIGLAAGPGVKPNFRRILTASVGMTPGLT